MEEITLKIKDRSKLKFFKQLLEQLDFIEMKKEKKGTKSEHTLLDSAGLWKDRSIDARNLRDQAWDRR